MWYIHSNLSIVALHDTTSNKNREELEKIDAKSRKRESNDDVRELLCIHGESRLKKHKLYLSSPWI
jgi:hypothetical protein